MYIGPCRTRYIWVKVPAMSCEIIISKYTCSTAFVKLSVTTDREISETTWRLWSNLTTERHGVGNSKTSAKLSTLISLSLRFGKQWIVLGQVLALLLWSAVAACKQVGQTDDFEARLTWRDQIDCRKATSWHRHLWNYIQSLTSKHEFCSFSFKQQLNDLREQSTICIALRRRRCYYG